jgi:hypothetical protein
MRRVILNRIIKRCAYGFSFILASYLVSFFGIHRALLDLRIDIIFLDFIYVLLVSFLPEILEWTGYGILISVVFLLLRYRVLPVHRLERRYLGIKGGSLVKYIFLCFLVVLLLFFIPYFLTQPPMTGEIITGLDQGIAQIGPQLAFMGGYAGGIISLAVSTLTTIFNFFVIYPLYMFSSTRLDAFLAAMFLSPLFYHTMMVSLSSRHIKVTRHVSKHLCQEGDKMVMKTTLSCPIPAPNVSLRSAPVNPGNRMKGKMKSRKSMSFMSVENTEELTLNRGYYNFDIVPVSISTLPFFNTTIYKVCDANSDISVIPPLKFRTRLFIRKPSVVRETGSLIRRQLGSSLDFAGLRDYAYGDPLSRIWWKGLAKNGELLVKQFHSFSEDRWMLVLDMTNPNLSADGTKGMLQFSRIFIELCTRKDISIGLSTFAPTFYYIDYMSNKRRLLSGLTKVTMPLYEISTKGVEMILHDALGSDLDKLKRKCREKHMTLSMVYSYSGLGRQKSYFSWKGENTFKKCMKKFFTNLHKSGKIIILTDGNPGNIAMFKKFKSICDNRRYPHMVILTEENKDMIAQFKRAKIKHMYVPYNRLVTPGFVMGLVSLV